MHIAAALSANRLCCAGDLGQHPFSELDVLRFIDRCGGYFGHPFLHHRFVRWTRLPTTSLLLETLADLGRNRSELLVENACWCSHGIWWRIRPALCNPPSGPFFISVQSRQAFFQEKKAPSDDFCSHVPRPPYGTLLRPYLA
jgi:hypothetical protein